MGKDVPMPTETEAPVDAGPEGALQPGEMVQVDAPGREPLALYNIDGRLFATDDTCTHALASLTEGELDGEVVLCPKHPGEFHVPSGEALCFPACEALRTYAVTVENGRVLIDPSRTGDEDGVPSDGTPGR